MLALLLSLFDELFGELSGRANVNLLNDRHTLCEQRHLLLSHFFENGDTAWWIDKLLTVHAVKELLDSISLLKFVEAHNRFLPCGVKGFKFGLVRGDDIFVESIQLGMLCLIPLLILNTVLNKELIDLRLEKEGNVDKVVSEFV